MKVEEYIIVPWQCYVIASKQVNATQNAKAGESMKNQLPLLKIPKAFISFRRLQDWVLRTGISMREEVCLV